MAKCTACPGWTKRATRSGERPGRTGVPEEDGPDLGESQGVKRPLL